MSGVSGAKSSNSPSVAVMLLKEASRGGARRKLLSPPVGNGVTVPSPKVQKTVVPFWCLDPAEYTSCAAQTNLWPQLIELEQHRPGIHTECETWIKKKNQPSKSVNNLASTLASSLKVLLDQLPISSVYLATLAAIDGMKLIMSCRKGLNHVLEELLSIFRSFLKSFQEERFSDLVLAADIDTSFSPRVFFNIVSPLIEYGKLDELFSSSSRSATPIVAALPLRAALPFPLTKDRLLQLNLNSEKRKQLADECSAKSFAPLPPFAQLRSSALTPSRPGSPKGYILSRSSFKGEPATPVAPEAPIEPPSPANSIICLPPPVVDLSAKSGDSAVFVYPKSVTIEWTTSPKKPHSSVVPEQAVAGGVSQHLVDTLVHAYVCETPYCSREHCQQAKLLAFLHGPGSLCVETDCLQCKLRADLLQLHMTQCAGRCNVTECRVARRSGTSPGGRTAPEGDPVGSLLMPPPTSPPMPLSPPKATAKSPGGTTRLRKKRLLEGGPESQSPSKLQRLE